MNKKITSLNDNKIPSYVSIYNQIYSDIVDGVYKNGSQLPSEPVLAEKYGVSRNTLRQALTILNEDHLIAKPIPVRSTGYNNTMTSYLIK